MRPVILVEPDADLRDLLVDLLTEAGYEVYVMASIQQARQTLEASSTPSIALIDQGVPRASDTEHLARIAALPEHTYLLLTTNPNHIPAVWSAQRLPVVIAEPFDIEDLLFTINQLANRDAHQ